MDNLTLLVVESPSKAKTISKYLGKDYIVRPTVGHIVDLSKGNGNIGVDIENGFKPKYADISDKKDVIAAILASAKSANNIVIASDPDREGEAIAFHVFEKLKNLGKPIKRAEFHEITKTGIQKGLSNLRDLDENLYNAQQARRVLDRIVGFIVSPYLIKKIDDKNLSAGRVQSVALRIIVDREKEIQAFVPENYWGIACDLSVDGKRFVAVYPSKIKSDAEANTIKDTISSASIKVSKVDNKDLVKYPPPPLNTADLQKAASVRYKFAADRTMKTAQSLYEMGAVTYIRSDSYRCSPESIQALREWIVANNFGLPKTENVHKNKDASQDAHEAIRPTNINEHPDSFVGSADQQNLYRLIWERFVASQMEPAIYSTVNVDIKATNGSEVIPLKASGKALKQKGYLNIIEEKEKDVLLPALQAGNDVKLFSVKSEKKTTKPPPRYNDGTIIDELKKRGIGRPSTYAAIITKISSRKYVTKVKNNFEPTDIGIKVVDDLVQGFSFMKYDYTAEMESQLDKVAEGNLQYEDLMVGFYKPFKEELQRVRNSEGKDTGILCPNCGEKTTLRHSQYGYFAGCIKYPDCRGVVGVRLEGENIIANPKHQTIPGTSCPDCSSEMVRRDGPFGPYFSCSKYPKCYGRRKMPFGKKCSKCNGELCLTVFKDEPKLACMEYPNCKNIENIPEGTELSWIPPKNVTPSKLPAKVEKVLKKKYE